MRIYSVRCVTYPISLESTVKKDVTRGVTCVTCYAVSSNVSKHLKVL